MEMPGLVEGSHIEIDVDSGLRVALSTVEIADLEEGPDVVGLLLDNLAQFTDRFVESALLDVLLRGRADLLLVDGHVRKQVPGSAAMTTSRHRDGRLRVRPLGFELESHPDSIPSIRPNTPINPEVYRTARALRPARHLRSRASQPRLRTLDTMPSIYVRTIALALSLCVTAGCQDSKPQADPAATRPDERQPALDTTQPDPPEADPVAAALDAVLPSEPGALPLLLPKNAHIGHSALADVDERYRGKGAPVEGAPEGLALAVDALESRNPGRENSLNLVRVELPRGYDPTPLLTTRWRPGTEGPDNSGVIINGQPLP